MKSGIRNGDMMSQWKKFQQVYEVPVTLSLILQMIKKWVKKEPYCMTITFQYKESGTCELTGAQLEFGKPYK